MLKTRRMRLDDKELREPENRPANAAINWILEYGKRTRGRPQKTGVAYNICRRSTRHGSDMSSRQSCQ